MWYSDIDRDGMKNVIITIKLQTLEICKSTYLFLLLYGPCMMQYYYT